MMTETKPCSCGCGKMVSRQVGTVGYFNRHWFVSQEHYRNHTKRKAGEKTRRVGYSGERIRA